MDPALERPHGELRASRASPASARAAAAEAAATTAEPAAAASRPASEAAAAHEGAAPAGAGAGPSVATGAAIEEERGDYRDADAAQDHEQEQELRDAQ